MAYTQLIKTLQKNLQQLSGQYFRQTCFYLHKRNVSTVSKFTFCGHMDVVSPRIAVKTRGCRSFSLYFTARNKSSPEDNDKSVSRYQSGTPKASTAQKGKTSRICRAHWVNIKSKSESDLHYRFVPLIDLNKVYTCLSVKDAGRDFTYLIVVLIGLGVTGGDSGVLNH